MEVFRYRHMASSPQTGMAHQDLMTAAASQLLPLTTTYKFLPKIFFPSHALWQFSDTETWFHHKLAQQIET
jgi:hypothetical protein